MCQVPPLIWLYVVADLGHVSPTDRVNVSPLNESAPPLTRVRVSTDKVTCHTMYASCRHWLGNVLPLIRLVPPPTRFRVSAD